MNYFAFLISGLLVVTGCHTQGPKFDAYAPTGDTNETFTTVPFTNSIDRALLKPSAEPYRLGPGDVIGIEAVGDIASHAVLTVGPDGKVYYSLLPGIFVWGLSVAEARVELQKELAKFTRATPELVVNLRVPASQRIWLLGAIASPGVYTMAGPTTLLDALTGSGGVSGATPDDAADLPRSFILRNGKLLPVDFERLLKRGDLNQNIYLAPDDFVFVRPSDVPSVYVLGAVLNPTILPYSRDLSVAEAVLKAGGPLKYSQQNRVAILRGGLTQPRIANVDYKSMVTGKTRNVRLEPGDIIYVSHWPLYRVAQFAEEVLDQFVRTVAVNEGVRVIDSSKGPVGISSPYGISP